MHFKSSDCKVSITIVNRNGDEVNTEQGNQDTLIKMFVQCSGGLLIFMIYNKHERSHSETWSANEYSLKKVAGSKTEDKMFSTKSMKHPIWQMDQEMIEWKKCWITLWCVNPTKTVWLRTKWCMITSQRRTRQSIMDFDEFKKKKWQDELTIIIKLSRASEDVVKERSKYEKKTQE